MLPKQPQLPVEREAEFESFSKIPIFKRLTARQYPLQLRLILQKER